MNANDEQLSQGQDGLIEQMDNLAGELKAIEEKLAELALRKSLAEKLSKIIPDAL